MLIISENDVVKHRNIKNQASVWLNDIPCTIIAIKAMMGP